MTHSILVLRFAGNKDDDTYQQWAEPVEVEDLPICPSHGLTYREVCAACEYERAEIAKDQARLMPLYGRTEFGSLEVERAIIRPTGYTRPEPKVVKKKSTKPRWSKHKR